MREQPVFWIKNDFFRARICIPYLLRSPGIDSPPVGPVGQPYLTYRPARLNIDSLESIPRLFKRLQIRALGPDETKTSLRRNMNYFKTYNLLIKRELSQTVKLFLQCAADLLIKTEDFYQVLLCTYVWYILTRPNQKIPGPDQSI